MSNTGGPAYPTNNYAAIVPISTGYSEGMTLRDYFAAKAMLGILTNNNLEDCDDFVVANCAYQMADFMLKARGGK